jgi:DUF2934 family protein
MIKMNCPEEERVRVRAYQIYLERGGQPGHDMDDWLQAEYELLQLPVRKIAELNPSGHNGGRRGKVALISLVHTAMLLGAEALPYLKR